MASTPNNLIALREKPSRVPVIDSPYGNMAESHRTFQTSRAPLAIVTGASGGVGQAIASGLSQRGYRLILISRDQAALQARAAEWRRNAPCLVAPMDLSDTLAILPAIERLLRTAGAPAEVLISAAGCGIYRPMMQQTDEQHLLLWQINYLAAYSMIRAVLPGMLHARRGHVISIASISSKMGPWGHTGYAGAKAAIVSLMQTLAAEHHRSGVHFSYVNPGIVDTPFFQKSDTQGLWSVVGKRAIAPAAIAAGTLSLLDRPRLELCIPRHYRLLDLIRAISVPLAHRLVRLGSTPDKPAAQPSAGDFTIQSSHIESPHIEPSRLDSVVSK